MEDAYRWKIITLDEGKRLLDEAHRRLMVVQFHLCGLQGVPHHGRQNPPIPINLTQVSIELETIAQLYRETVEAIREFERGMKDTAEEYYSARTLTAAEEMGIDFYATQSERVFQKRD